MSSVNLSERKQGILYAIVQDYISSAEPIGSLRVAQRKGIHLSSATVRTVMAELEERGFLRRPHSSSGCIPTAQAYRFYVDHLVHFRALSPDEREDIRSRVEAGVLDLNGALKDACRLVSTKAHHPGLVLAPRQEERSLQHVEFIRIRPKVVLAVLVTGNGIVENKILELDEPVAQNDLSRMHNYLNDRLHGLAIAQVRREILLEMKRIQNQYDDMLCRALLLGERAFSDGPRDIHIEGQSTLLGDPEFANLAKMQQILGTLEEKTRLIRLLDQSMATPGIKIFIGDDVEFPEINGLTMIASAYSDSEGNRGVLGVIGPTRLNYARIVPLVDYTARIMTDVLKERAE